MSFFPQLSKKTATCDFDVFELHSKENMESHKYWSYNKDIDLVN